MVLPEVIKDSILFKKIYYGFSIGTKLVNLRGVNVKVKRQIFNKYAEFNPEIENYIKKRDINKNDIVLDIGAYVGYFTLYAAKKATNGKVITFEPIPWNYKILTDNIKLNKLNNVELHKLGISNIKKEIRFIGKGGSSKIEMEKGDLIVPVTSIDLFLKDNSINYKDVSFVMMDIEGEEVNAVVGARNLIKKGSAFWAIASYHNVNGKQTYEFLEQYFKKFGYHVFTEKKGHMTTYAWK